jgi:DNA polymerase-3 subunit delta
LRVSLNSFPSHLSEGFNPLYLLFGAEPLLVEEALDQFRSQARQQGFQERLRYTVETGFDWNQLLHQGQSMSLFAEKRVIELRMPSGKPGDAGTKAIIAYCEMLPEDTTLIIVSGPVDKRSQGTRWFKAVENVGVVVESPEIKPDRLPDWISQRLTSQGLTYDFDAVERIGQMVEGNLLAAAQEINLLSLLYPNEKITSNTIDTIIADHARFNVYTLADACLAGTSERVCRILQSLKREQAEPIVILWALSRDVRTLCHLSSAAERTGQPVKSLFNKHGVWSARSGIVSMALRRMSNGHWENILRRLGRADLMVKGSVPLQKQNIWEELESISLSICGVRIP